MSTPVATILATKGSNVVTITPDATVADAVAVLTRHNIGAVIVSCGDGSVDGVLSERDVVRCLAQYGATALGLPVAEAMTKEVVTCARDDTDDGLMSLMTKRRIRHIPVVEDGRLRGVISIGDVVKSRIDDLEFTAERLQEYVTGSTY